jgi:hypothetical protein
LLKALLDSRRPFDREAFFESYALRVVCEAYCTSRRIHWSHTAHDLSTTLALNDSNVVLALQIKPELGTISKISTEPDGCISSDRPASIEYVRDATGRYAEIEREPICTELARF